MTKSFSYIKHLNTILYNPLKSSSHTTFTIHSSDLPKFLTDLSTIHTPQHIYNITIKQTYKYHTITISLNEEYKFGQ